MEAFFEIRFYPIRPGKTAEMVAFAEQTIFPFLASKGMTITGSFVKKSTDQFSLENGERVMNTQEDGETFVWIRRFESLEDKEKLYKDAYENETWTQEILPIVSNLVDRDAFTIHNLAATPGSAMK